MGNWAWGMGNWALGMGHGALNLPIHSFPLPSSLSLVPSVTESAAELLSLNISIENSSSFPARLFPAK